MASIERTRLHRTTFLVIFALAAYLFWRTLEPIWVPVFLGLVIAVGVYPLHERLLRRLGGKHPGLPAALLTASVMVLTLCLIAFLALVVGHRALDLAREIAARYQKRGAEGVLGGEAAALRAARRSRPEHAGRARGDLAARRAHLPGRRRP